MKKNYFIKSVLLLTFSIFSYQFSFSQGQETFDNIDTSSSTSYRTRTWTGDDGSTWTSTNSRTSGADINGNGVGLNDDQPNTYVESGTISNGIGSLTLTFKQIFSGTDTGTLTVYVNNNQVGTVTYNNDENGPATTTSINNINVAGDFVLRIANETGGSNGGGDNRIAIDDVIWTAFAGSSNPTVGFDSSTSSESETNTSFNTTIPVTFSNYASDVTVSVSVDGSSTAEAGDYTLNTNSLTFNSNGSQNISLDINDDADQDNETIVLNISVTSGTADLATSQHTVTINDNDIPEIIISEIVYNTPSTDDEWIEIFNAGTSTINLDSWTLEYSGGTFTFPSTSINAGQFVVIAVGSNGDGTFNNDAPFTPDLNNLMVTNDAVKDTNDTNNLGNSSGTITLKNSGGTTVDSVFYDDGDASSTDGNGNSYEVINTSIANDNTNSNWQASINAGGSPKRSSGLTWTGNTNNDWSTATNWSSELLPSSSSDVLIPNGLSDYPTISSATTVNSISIESGASLISNAAVTGNVTYTRNLPTDNWYLVGSPVNGQSIAGFVAAHNLATGSTNGGNTNLGFSQYDNDSGWVYITDNTPLSNNLPSGLSIGIKLATAGDISFTGTLNTSNVTQQIKKGTNTNFNLIANPFTSYTNSATVTAANTAILSEETVWLWNGTQYVTYNNATPIELAPTQGFFVEANNSISGSVNFTFSTANQSHQSSDTFMRQTPTSSFELAIENGTDKNATKVFYVDGKTTSFDNGYDSKIFEGVQQDFAVFTQLLSNNDGRKLAIQTLPNNNLETMVIPVGLITDADEEITFSAITTNLPSGVNVYLEDRVNNTFVNLSEGNHTIQTKSANNGIGQYYIHTTSAKLSNDDISKDIKNVSIYSSANNEITVTGLQAEANVKVFSLLGEELINSDINSNGVSKISLPSLSTGVYVVKLNSTLGNITKKVILE